MSGSSRVDEAAIRSELTVQFDACDACRACVSLCATFPLMFDLIHRAGPDALRTAGDLVVVEQDRIVDACVRCGLCTEACGFGYDVPALADRALAMRRATGQLSWRRRATELRRRVGFRRRSRRAERRTG